MSEQREEMRCPRCHSRMVTLRRSGISIDECTGCRGIFLDRGELEGLMAAEDGHYAGESGAFYPEAEGHHQQAHRRQRRGFLRSLLG